MKRYYNFLLFSSYVIATFFISVSLHTRMAFFLIWTTAKEILLFSSAVIVLFLHYYLMWKVHRANLTKYKMVEFFRIVDYFLYGGHLIFLAILVAFASIPFISLDVQAELIIPDSILSFVILGLRKYASENWD